MEKSNLLQATSLTDIMPNLIVVNKGSSETLQNGSYQYPYKTIQAAINSIATNNVIHKNVATILIQSTNKFQSEADWIYEENLTRPYSYWINFLGAIQPSVDTIAPFDPFSTNRMIKIKGNVLFNGGLNHFENLDLSDAFLDMRDTSLTVTSCRLGNLTKSTYSPTAWCRIKDCRGSGTISMKNGYLILDNYMYCKDSNGVNLEINGGFGVKIHNSSNINLQTSVSSVKPYVEANNTYFTGLNIMNADYVTLLGGGVAERLSTTKPTYALGGIRIAQGTPYNLTMFSYDPWKSVL